MSLSKAQIENDPKRRYQLFFWIWERDLLELARRYSDWRFKAYDLGFRDETIDTLWIQPDLGRHIKWSRNPSKRLQGSTVESI